MQITTLRLANFQSFGPNPTDIKISDISYVIGPNGAGKTAVLEALTRLFSPLHGQRKVRLSDFHVPWNCTAAEVHSTSPELWIEADIEFPEAGDDKSHASIPPNFAHMRITSREGVPSIRVRLTAVLEQDGFIEERIEYILNWDEDGNPISTAVMSRYDRANIEVHYLPAQRNPADHISYATASLIGRTLRAADWTNEKETLSSLSQEITESLTANESVKGIGVALSTAWSGLHKGDFFKDPTIAFGQGDIESVLRQLTVSFSPSHDGIPLPFERLSDGQKSLLYISLVLAWQSISRKVLNDEEKSLDVHRLRPPVHTVIALEEPENSLAPQYLGRIIRQLRTAVQKGDVQSLIATHTPALLRRVDPETVCFLRLDNKRQSQIREIILPNNDSDANKYVREAVLAHPELYFSRLTILGEGDSEQAVLERVLAAADIAADDASISVVPLGGRHVNHFWRLLDGLKIPYITLLDLDAGRYQGGWGRIRYALNQINAIKPESYPEEYFEKIPNWNEDVDFPHLDYMSCGSSTSQAMESLERQSVYFSHPIDLDFTMMAAFPEAYATDPTELPAPETLVAVLGKSHTNAERLDASVLKLLDDYHKKFKLSSKPVTHMQAMSKLSDQELLGGLPPALKRLIKDAKQQLEELPE